MFTRSFAALLAVAPAAVAYGPDAHSTVAHIADTRLSETARKGVDELMGAGVRLADWSSWADTILYGDDGAFWKWSSGLHYVNFPGDACSFDYSRDCKDDYCVAGAIHNYTARMTDTKLSVEQRRNALQFLVHFIGDIHQPLHVGSSDNLGGNTIKVDTEFADEKAHKIHKVWDEKLLDQFEEDLYSGDYLPQDHDYDMDRTPYWTVTFESLDKELKAGGRYADQLDSWVEDCKVSGWNACVNGFAAESADIVCKEAYRGLDGDVVKDGDTWTMEYYDSRGPTVVDQLAKGGIRLAYILESSFGSIAATTTTLAPTPTSTTPASAAASNTVAVFGLLASLMLLIQ